MLKYQRNKLVSVNWKDKDTLAVHGVLDDDIYALDLDVDFRLPELEIQSIRGTWRRWTTPECPRSSDFLNEAIGFRVYDEDYSQKVQKVVGRKSCRHYANLLLEMSHSAREAVCLIGYELAKAESAELTLEEFLKNPASSPIPAAPNPVKAASPPIAKDSNAPTPPIEKPPLEKPRGSGPVIDLHVHTSPASACSSAPVDALIQEAREIGLDGICLTDHNHVWSAEAVEELSRRHGFLVLRGNEITTDQGDVLVFGLERDVKELIRLSDLKEEVDQADGFIVLAHPFRGFLIVGLGQTGQTVENAMSRALFKNVHAVETLNGKVTPNENQFAARVAEGLSLPATGGSDAHEVDEVGKYATRFQTEIKNERDLIQALKSGNYQPASFRRDRGL